MADNSVESSGLNALMVRIGKRWKYAVMGAAVLLLAAAAAYAVVDHRRTAAAREVNEELFAISNDAMTKPDFDAAAAFADIAGRHRGVPAAAQALIIEYRFTAGKGDLKAAEEVVRRFLREYPDNIFVSRMRLALGQNLLSQDRVPEALAILEELTSGDVIPEARLAIAQARAREAEAISGGDKTEYQSRLEAARDAYTQIISEGRMNGWPNEVVAVAEYSLVIVRDKLAGYAHPAPPPLPQPEAAAPEAGGDAALPALPETAGEGEPADGVQAGTGAPETTALPPSLPEADGEDKPADAAPESAAPSLPPADRDEAPAE